MRRFITIVIFIGFMLAIAGCGTADVKSELPVDSSSHSTTNSPNSSSGSSKPFDGSGSSDSLDSSGTTDSSNMTGGSGSFEISNPFDQSGTSGSSNHSDSSDSVNSTWRIKVINTEGSELWSFTEFELTRLQQERAGAFAHVYSTINNWPTTRFYAADGYRVENILLAAEALDTAQTITFRAADGYEVSLTREQLLGGQYYFPKVGENDSGAVPVMPIIAYKWREGTDDLSDIRNDSPIMVFGQSNPFEHTNPAFVEDIVEIIVDDAPSAAWLAAGTFPLPGIIAEGETVKLQHPDLGLVKLHYTLDGSDPTPLSAMYNPSTYQLELNQPIPITEPTTVKVLVTGFGKKNSEIAVFEFVPIR